MKGVSNARNMLSALKELFEKADKRIMLSDRENSHSALDHYLHIKTLIILSKPLLIVLKLEISILH